MKYLKLLLTICVTTFVFTSCEKDEGKLPNIEFVMDANHVSTNTTKAGGSTVLMGIIASKSEKKDVLKKFDISKSINGGPAVSVYDKSISGSEGDNYAYDFLTTIGTISGQTETFSFTVTNRDGLTNQVVVTIVIQ